MNRKKRSDSFGINVGISSLLLVFVILCLVSFATLSLVSANANKKLNDKVISRTESYYNACNEANERLSNIDASLIDAYILSSSEDEYRSIVGETIDFAITVSEMQTLHIKADINYPVSDDDTFYTITSWKVETTGSLELDESLDLIEF